MTKIQFTLIWFVLTISPVVGQDTSNSGFRIFDGKPKTIVVNGYSTSFQWPKILQRKLEVEYPDYYESKYAFKPETSESLQKVLSEDDLLVEYAVTDSEVFIFTLAKDQPLQLQKVSLNNTIPSNINHFYSLLQNSSQMRKATRKKFISLSHQLYRQFLLPIEERISEKNRLVVIRDGITNYIPFEVLLASDDIKPFRKLEYLIKNHEVSYHYSSNLFAKIHRRKEFKNSGIYAFAPVHDDEDTSTEITANILPVVNHDLRASSTDGKFSPLPGNYLNNRVIDVK